MNPWSSKLLLVLVTALSVSACTTTYEFVSEPDGATVYQTLNGQKALLGTTPFSFKKSGLPTGTPFLVSFERPGFEALDVMITPTDEALTKVTGTLRPGGKGTSDPQLARMRAVITQLFRIQQYAYQKRTVDALALLRELEAKEPDLAEVYLLKGSLYLALNDAEQATVAWRRALTLDPKLDELRAELQRIESSKGASTP